MLCTVHECKVKENQQFTINKKLWQKSEKTKRGAKNF